MSTRASFEVRRFATLGSTNSYLLDEARRGAPAGLVAVAAHQSAGRGRLGRRWEAPPGTCLLLSVLLRPALAPEDLHLCTAAVALAAADAAAVVAGVTPRLKWPNDLLIGEKKVAGVLAESDPGAPGGPPGSVAVVVGIGCNVNWPGPPGVGGTSLSQAAGRPVEVDALLDAVLDALAERHRLLATPAGRGRLVEAWRAACDTLGRGVRVELVGGEQLHGVAVDLTPAGHLVVETSDGPVSVGAGDVVHLRPGGGPTGAK